VDGKTIQITRQSVIYSLGKLGIKAPLYEYASKGGGYTNEWTKCVTD